MITAYIQALENLVERRLSENLRKSPESSVRSPSLSRRVAVNPLIISQGPAITESHRKFLQDHEKLLRQIGILP